MGGHIIKTIRFRPGFIIELVMGQKRQLEVQAIQYLEEITPEDESEAEAGGSDSSAFSFPNSRLQKDRQSTNINEFVDFAEQSFR